jgi:pimeloyl-ACP methyl ester carboxylesterase
VPFAAGPAGPVHWAEAGAGPPLVLLHGLGGDIGFEHSQDPVQMFRIRCRCSG